LPPAPTTSSLRRRLVSQLAVPLLVLFAIDGAISYWAVRHYANDVYDRWLYDSLHSLARQVRLIGDRPALDLPPIAQEMFEWDAEDRVLFRVVGAKSGHIAGDPLLPVRGEDETDFHDALLFNAQAQGAPMRFAALTLSLPPPGEAVTVVVGETTRKRDRLADEILFYVWFPQFFLLMLAYWAAYRIIFVQTEQIHRLSTSLRDVSYQKLQAVPGHDMPEEMRPLIEALNAMISKLDAAALAHRTFIANAAHQLRTPLTALNLQAERALHCESADDMRQAVLDLQEAVRRATRLTNQLLLLSRAEPEAQSGANRTRTDLYELAFETARDWVPTAVAVAIDLGFDESSTHAVAEVDAALVADAINNLLDNALKYCPPHAKITVSVRLLPDPTIIVEDTGPGIPAAERSRVIQRFYRGDNATDEGTGLGLAIAHEVALAHAGQFVITETEGGGARFEMHFPAA
jgi:two-component system sensor histidine kinase TctE